MLSYGMFLGWNPCHRAVPSLNSDFASLKFYLFSGRTINQLDNLFSEARSNQCNSSIDSSVTKFLLYDFLSLFAACIRSCDGEGRGKLCFFLLSSLFSDAFKIMVGLQNKLSFLSQPHVIYIIGILSECNDILNNKTG